MEKWYKLKNIRKARENQLKGIQKPLNDYDDDFKQANIQSEDDKEEERLRKKLFSREFDIPYLQKKRDCGSGPFRIGTAISRSEDMYNLLFTA